MRGHLTNLVGPLKCLVGYAMVGVVADEWKEKGQEAGKASDTITPLYHT